MSVIVESGRNIQIRVTEGFCQEINKLDVPARLHAIGLIVESLKNLDEHLVLQDSMPHLTDLRGIGHGTWGGKTEIDDFTRKERNSWDF